MTLSGLRPVGMPGVVDYLHQARVGGAAASADHVRDLGGMAAVLKKARGREVLRAADETLQDDDGDFGRGAEPDETPRTSAASGHSTDERFDPETDLSIRVGSEMCARVQGAEINMNESFYLECRKTGSIGRTGFGSSADGWTLRRRDARRYRRR